MTTIVGTKTHLYSDSMGWFEGIPMKMTKLWRIHGALYGFCGNYDNIMNFVARLQKKKNLVEAMDFNGDIMDFDYLKLTKKGLFLATGYSQPAPIHEDYMAIGSGKDFAITAMHCGKSARQAVSMGIRMDMNSAGSILQVKL